MNEKVFTSKSSFLKKGISLMLFVVIFVLYTLGSTTCHASTINTYWSEYMTSIKPNGTTYTVTTASDLAWVAGQVNSGNSFEGCTIELGADLDLSSHYWVPIGCAQKTVFKGNFNGNNHKILGMNVSGSYVNVGLFGFVYDNTIKDVSINSANIQATASCAGILAACVYFSTISGCSANGDLSTSGAGSVGGLTGYNFCCLVINCSSTGSVTATQNNDLCVGGLVGNNVGISDLKSMIKNSYTTSNVTGTRTGSFLYLGGLNGFNDNGIIQNCYEAGIVTDLSIATGNTFVGGFIGYNRGQYSILTNYWWEGCGKIFGLGSGSANDLNKVTTNILKNNGAIPSGTYASYWILDALNAAAKSITGAKGWAMTGYDNNHYPILWNP